VLIHADTELGAKDLLNNRMAYVAVSRGAYDAQIFTNDRPDSEAGEESRHGHWIEPLKHQEQMRTTVLSAPLFQRGHSS
jgi:hypothetical protein